MNHCHVSSQIANHAHLLGIEQARDLAIESRALELLEEECYPYSAEAIGEALSNFNPAWLLELETLIINNRATIGALLHDWIGVYWQKQAEHKAKQEFKETSL